jgi:glucose/arabinose dehydrogenase
VRQVLHIEHSSRPNHNGGLLQFGPDGFLYASTGDGGGAGDPDENAQTRASLLGKLLRIAPAAGDGDGYTVPADNPFVGQPGAEVWSWGLRNPWRYSFDPVTRDLIIADVGQGAWEEIDFAPAANGGGRGVNWGWNCREGMHAYPSPGASCPAAGAVDPVLELSHRGGFCSITGGVVVRDPGLASLLGRYLYADFCKDKLRVRAARAATGVRGPRRADRRSASRVVRHR